MSVPGFLTPAIYQKIMRESTDAHLAIAMLGEWLDGWAVHRGFSRPKLIGPNRWACLYRLGWTCSIVTGALTDWSGYDDRWDFRNEAMAHGALNAWDGVGEPVWWHLHPKSGRRMVLGAVFVAP